MACSGCVWGDEMCHCRSDAEQEARNAQGNLIMFFIVAVVACVTWWFLSNALQAGGP